MGVSRIITCNCSSEWKLYFDSLEIGSSELGKLQDIYNHLKNGHVVIRNELVNP